MSLAARINLVRPGGGLVFQDLTQRLDLLNPWRTQTELIEHLTWLTQRGHIIELTAVRSDHHDDSGLGTPPDYWGTHARGSAWDGWLNRSRTPGDYENPNSHNFRQFLRDIASAPRHKQTGLAGSADTPDNRLAAGPTVFGDDGGDHVHGGVTA